MIAADAVQFGRERPHFGLVPYARQRMDGAIEYRAADTRCLRNMRRDVNSNEACGMRNDGSQLADRQFALQVDHLRPACSPWLCHLSLVTYDHNGVEDLRASRHDSACACRPKGTTCVVARELEVHHAVTALERYSAWQPAVAKQCIGECCEAGISRCWQAETPLSRG